MPFKNKVFQTIKRSSAVEDIIENFKAALIEGELHPGQRLPSEFELGQQLGVGRGTVREAMKMLRAMGVVRIQQGDGSYIAHKPSASLLNPLIFAVMLQSSQDQDMLELRAMIETGSYQLAAQHATAEDWARIEAAEQNYINYVRSLERTAVRQAELDLEFHLSLIDACHNPLVIKIGRTVEELFLIPIRDTLAHLRHYEDVITEHRAIVLAVKSGHPDHIYQAVRQHLNHWANQIQAKLVQ